MLVMVKFQQGEGEDGDDEENDGQDEEMREK